MPKVTWLPKADPGLEAMSSNSQSAWLVFPGAGPGEGGRGKQQQRQMDLGPAVTQHTDMMESVTLGGTMLCRRVGTSPTQKNIRGEICLWALTSLFHFCFSF